MKTIGAAHTAEPHLDRSGVWPDIGFTVLSILLILIAAIDEGGRMVQRGLSESKMLESDMGHKLLRSGVTQSDSPISARVVHEGASLIVGHLAQNLRVAIRNNTDPRKGVAIALRGVHWAGEGEDTRQWLRPLRGRTVGDLEEGVGYQAANTGTTTLAFETGLLLPGEELMVPAPLTPRRNPKHDFVVSYAVVKGDGGNWMREVLIQFHGAPRYRGAMFVPATPESVSKRWKVAELPKDGLWDAGIDLNAGPSPRDGQSRLAAATDSANNNPAPTAVNRLRRKI